MKIYTPPKLAVTYTDEEMDDFLYYYFDTTNDSYLNIHIAASLAKLTQAQEQAITKQEWFTEKIAEERRDILLDKAESNLYEFLELDATENPLLLPYKLKASIFVAETLGKENYSKRVESNQTVTINIFDKLKEIEDANSRQVVADEQSIQGYKQE